MDGGNISKFVEITIHKMTLYPEELLPLVKYAFNFGKGIVEGLYNAQDGRRIENNELICAG